MKTYIVRKSLDLSIAILAASEEEACSMAAQVSDDEWASEWSELDAEQETD